MSGEHPERCPTCAGEYSRAGFTVCSAGFHCCRDCVMSAGVVTRRCMPCDLDHHKGLYRRAVDLLAWTAIRSEAGLSYRAMYNPSFVTGRIRDMLEDVERRIRENNWGEDA